jgi:hypothetical protein
MAVPTTAEFLDFAPARLGRWVGVADTFTLAAARLVSPDDGSTLLVLVSASPASWAAATDEGQTALLTKVLARARRTLEHMASIRWDEFAEWDGDGVLSLDLEGHQIDPPKESWGEDEATRVVAPFPRPDDTPLATAVADESRSRMRVAYMANREAPRGRSVSRRRTRPDGRE